MKKKRILMIAPTPFFSERGCHVRILNSYLRLKREHHEIDLFTYPIGRDLKGVPAKRTIRLPGYSKTAPGFSPYKPFLDVLLYFKIKTAMKKKKYDVVYGHLHEGALIGYFLKKKFGTPVIFDAQGSFTGELSAQGTIKKKGLVYSILWKIEKFITQNSDEIITSTDGLKQFLEKNFKTKKVTVIKDLPDKGLFSPRTAPAKIKLPKARKIVVYLGGLQKYKGISYLIKAIPHVDKDTHFLIMGFPVEEAKELAKEIGVEDRITFTGKIPYEKAPSYLKLGDVAVSPKTLESGEANAKIYNYISMNLPVVCFDIPETRQIQKEYPQAKMILAKEKDIKDLARKINSVKPR